MFDPDTPVTIELLKEQHKKIYPEKYPKERSFPAMQILTRRVPAPDGGTYGEIIEIRKSQHCPYHPHYLVGLGQTCWYCLREKQAGAPVEPYTNEMIPPPKRSRKKEERWQPNEEAATKLLEHVTGKKVWLLKPPD